MTNKDVDQGRRDFLRTAGFVAGAAVARLAFGELPVSAEESELKPLPFENGKYQTFQRSVVCLGNNIIPVLHEIDLGTLGPDVDTIFGIDFPGNIRTGALVVHMPEGEVLETRVVGIKRTDLETVQFNLSLGGDRFDVYQISKFGGDKALDEMARLHAQNTAREHQKVIYLGDFGLFQKQYGEQETALMKAILRAQRPIPSTINTGIPDFVNPRIFQK